MIVLDLPAKLRTCKHNSVAKTTMIRLGFNTLLHRQQPSRSNNALMSIRTRRCFSTVASYCQNRNGGLLDPDSSFGCCTRLPSRNHVRTFSIIDLPNDDNHSNERSIIDALAKEQQTSVSLQALMRTGRGEYLRKTFKEEEVERHTATDLVLIQVASFLRRELPIRLAHRIQDLEGIPILRDMVSVKQVKDAYIKSVMEIVNFDSKIISTNQEERFSVLIENIYERHASVLVQMARGAYEFRKAVREDKGCDEVELEEETHEFLDRFYLSRIGIRVLIGQYLALRQPPVENYVGIICSQTSPYEIVKRAIDDAAFMCTRKYGEAPEVIMSGRLDLTFPYVPTHLRK